jgi:hypothetical protein
MALENKNNKRRGKEVLKYVTDHTLVSKQVIKPVLKPKMSNAGLKKTMGLLVKKGILDTRKAHGKTFYEIGQDIETRTKAARLLGCHPDDLKKPKIRTQDLLHHEICEFWIWTIRHHFHEAIIIRDYEMDNSEVAKDILLNLGDSQEVYPDFLVIFPRTDLYARNAIAFEIERTRKSDDRILRKLKKYAVGTCIDGLVYICDSARLSETIRQLWEKSQHDSWRRIGHYSDFFFLFSDVTVPEDEPLEYIYNVKGNALDFRNWVVRLLGSKHTLRRNHLFADLVQGGQQNPGVLDS